MALEDAVKPKYALDIILKNEPTIIFSVFKSQGIRTVAKYLDEIGWKYGEITGDVKPNIRRQLVKQFNDTSLGQISSSSFDVSRSSSFDGSRSPSSSSSSFDVSRSSSSKTSPESISKPLNTILLTAAGGEGLDFIGVRHIICLECEWNYAQIEQVIGRGPRRHSHAHLPPEERLVNVHLLCLVKPPRDQLHSNDHIFESADQMLRRMAKQKLKEIAPIKRLLKRINP